MDTQVLLKIAAHCKISLYDIRYLSGNQYFTNASLKVPPVYVEKYYVHFKPTLVGTIIVIDLK